MLLKSWPSRRIQRDKSKRAGIGGTNNRIPYTLLLCYVNVQKPFRIVDF
ncbi:hypothetical protein ACFVIX_22725 [Bacillus subtilis]|uniref:Uncharacterized protein n=2 Tax=Bacillus subtilis TaxID=1423 RepID=A0AAX3RT19_BACIU|nr:hypothetical protein [Bacillus subtilis]OTQ81941.1 hypothetical protein BG30_21805 [Bacillus subtilis subsp. subtilis]MEC0312366.1 hypothetical protein [Bacillus subtilis]MEC0360427.1 hypothetical protein [Bacillus subtilis]MED3603920.1 hypothetical protein [Bacillus subtilis]MED3625990.1 hypothetical protein [Bacillus subtilis]